jgi:hypothetical protein
MPDLSLALAVANLGIDTKVVLGGSGFQSNQAKQQQS